MRTGVSFTGGPDDQRRLKAIVADRNSKKKHVWRARIILESAHGHGTMEIMRRTGKSKNCVWRWQRRYMLEGVDGLPHDAMRPPGRAPIPDPKVREVVALTMAPARRRGDPLDAASHGSTGRPCFLDRAPHLAAARLGAAPLAALQAVDGPGVRGQAARRRGALRQPARACGGPVGGREISDSGAGGRTQAPLAMKEGRRHAPMTTSVMARPPCLQPSISSTAR